MRVELDKIRASKPKHMPTTMMRIHEIHNKLNREADSEKARMDLVIQLTRTDIFDIIRSHYPFLYSQIVEKENAIRTRYRKEQRISKLLTGDTQAKRGVEYHPFNTLFQLTCKFLRSHEPLTVKPNQGSVNTISQEDGKGEPAATAGEVAAVQENYAPKPQPPNTRPGNDRPQPNAGCYGCGSTEHFVRNCPSVAP